MIPLKKHHYNYSVKDLKEKWEVRNSDVQYSIQYNTINFYVMLLYLSEKMLSTGEYCLRDLKVKGRL